MARVARPASQGKPDKPVTGKPDDPGAQGRERALDVVPDRARVPDPSPAATVPPLVPEPDSPPVPPADKPPIMPEMAAPSITGEQVRYAVFLLREDREGETFGPTKARLAKHFGVPQTHVQQRLDELVAAGGVESRAGGTWWVEAPA